MVISDYHRWKSKSTTNDLCIELSFFLILTKLLFETSFMSFQYNTKGRRLSNYSIKQILCSYYRSRYNGLCQNKKHGFGQNAKGGHFSAAHITLRNENTDKLYYIVYYSPSPSVMDQSNLSPRRKAARWWRTFNDKPCILPQFLIICSTNTFQSKFAFIEWRKHNIFWYQGCICLPNLIQRDFHVFHCISV